MNQPLDETHDPNLMSWIESANDPRTDFPIQNLPLCRLTNLHQGRLCVRIGDEILDLVELEAAGLFRDIFEDPELNLVHGLSYTHERTYWMIDEDPATPAIFLILPAAFRVAVRRRLSALLRGTDDRLRRNDPLRQRALRSVSDASLAPPMQIFRNYTDFYASIHHATTVGSMFRPDNPLLPNYKHIPIGYHGRASSIIHSGTPIVRPRGQQAPPDDNPAAGPTFGPSTMLDYELEIGAVISRANNLGEPVSLKDAEHHILGLCLVNDWSARDIQKWEYQPLGPFLAKSFATTISPYIVTLDALAPFRCPACKRPDGDPPPLPYLFHEDNEAHGGIDLTLEVQLRSAEMEKRGMSPITISRSNAFKDMYWTFAQMVAHHTSNGCNLQTGDLLASGTVSGTDPGTRGCLLESTWQGRGSDGKPLPRKPIELPTGEKRIFLHDGDEVILKAWGQREGFRRIGFGECRGKILPAKIPPT